MNQSLEIAVRSFTTAPSSGTSHDLLMAFHRAEHEAAPAYSHRLPYYTDLSPLPPAQRAEIHALLCTTNFANTFEDEITQTALALRTGTAKPDLSGLIARLDDTAIQNLDQVVLFEICNILHALRAWGSLEKAARTGLKRDLDPYHTSLMADWLVLALWKQMAPAFTSNTLTPEAVASIEADAITATGKLPAEGRNRLLYRALFACMRKDHQTAVDLMLAGQKQTGTQLALFKRMDCVSDPTALKATNTKLLTTLTQSCDFHFTHAAGASPVLLISTDKGYFDEYADNLIASFAATNPGGLLHLHCIDFAPEAQQLQSLSTAHHIRINHTVDKQQIIPRGSEHFNGYCAGARFLFLPEYLQHYSHIALTDVDGIIKRPLTDLWQGQEGQILLTGKLLDPSWQSGRMLWEAISAGSFAITNTTEGKRFAGVLAGYLCNRIEDTVANNAPLFFTDQLGLMLAYLALREDCAFGRCMGLYGQGGNWKLGDEGSKKAAQKAALKG